MDTEITTIDDVSSMTNPSEGIKLTGLGVRLKAAREAMNLTEKEAAARLYLNTKIISCIENEAFIEGPPLTFMRGYLKSYAKLLDFPEKEIQTALEEIERAVPLKDPDKLILQARPIPRTDRYLHWITYLVVLTLIVLVCIWWSSHSRYVISDVPVQHQAISQPIAKTPLAAPISHSNSQKDNAISPNKTDSAVSKTKDSTPSGMAATTPEPPVNTTTSATHTDVFSAAPSLPLAATLPIPAGSSLQTSPADDNSTTAPKTKKPVKREKKTIISTMALPEPE